MRWTQPSPMNRLSVERIFERGQESSARFWTAPVLWRFRHAGCVKSGRGLPHCKTLPRRAPVHGLKARSQFEVVSLRSERGEGRGEEFLSVSFRLRNCGVNPDISHIGLGSARSSRAVWDTSPQTCTRCFQHTVGGVDVQTVGEAPTGTRGGACAPQNL